MLVSIAYLLFVDAGPRTSVPIVPTTDRGDDFVRSGARGISPPHASMKQFRLNKDDDVTYRERVNRG